MFGARLHPYRPGAAERMMLERLGGALRAACGQNAEALSQPLSVLRELSGRRLTALGCPREHGGLGDGPMALVLAAERAGREGLRVGMALAAHMSATACGLRWGSDQVRSELVRSVLAENLACTTPTAWRLEPVPAAVGAVVEDGQPSGALTLSCAPHRSPILFPLGGRGDRGVVLWIARVPEEVSVDGAVLPVARLVGLRPVNEGLTGEAAELAASDLLMHLLLTAAAAAVGVASDAFQVVRAGGLGEGEAGSGSWTRSVAAAGTLLEALRSLVYAAAEAVRFWSSRPSHGMLAEVLPLVAEAFRFARERLPELLAALSAAAERVGRPSQRLAAHRADTRQLLATVPGDELDRVIARFYA